MAKVQSRRLVIDASVARSAGGPSATEPRSKGCREFLLSVLTICHQVVMTADIAEEWKRHRSSFARTWRVQMEARKKVVRPTPERNDALRKSCEKQFPAGANRDAVLKDMHLIEAALTTGRAVVSLDETARGLFSILAGADHKVSKVVWVNPEKREDGATGWLEAGAPDEDHRLLGRATA